MTCGRLNSGKPSAGRPNEEPEEATVATMAFHKSSRNADHEDAATDTGAYIRDTLPGLAIPAGSEAEWSAWQARCARDESQSCHDDRLGPAAGIGANESHRPGRWLWRRAYDCTTRSVGTGRQGVWARLLGG